MKNATCSLVWIFLCSRVETTSWVGKTIPCNLASSTDRMSGRIYSRGWSFHKIVHWWRYHSVKGTTPVDVQILRILELGLRCNVAITSPSLCRCSRSAFAGSSELIRKIFWSNVLQCGILQCGRCRCSTRDALPWPLHKPYVICTSAHVLRILTTTPYSDTTQPPANQEFDIQSVSRL